MSLWCVQGGRHRLRKLAGAALCALLAAAMYGCGTTEEESWEPTKDDTAGINATVEANKGYFRTGLAELAMTMCDTVLPGTTLTILSKDLQGNRFEAKFRLNALQHAIDTASYELKYTYIAGLNLDSLMRVDSSTNPWETTWVEPNSETTCTVTMAETIPGKVLMHAWERTVWLRDSVIVVSPSETLRLPFYSDTMVPCDTVIEKSINGASVEGCVLKKTDGEWRLWKMAGGGRFYAPGPDDAPYVVSLSLKGRDNRLDSVFLRPDTTHYGMQRFYSVTDQLLTYAVGDWVIATKPYTNQGNAYDYLYFNGRRYELGDTVKFDSVSSGNIYRLSIEHVPATVLWEVDGDYNATVWGIPIRIQ